MLKNFFLLAAGPAQYRRPLFVIDAQQQRVDFKEVNFNPEDPNPK